MPRVFAFSFLYVHSLNYLINKSFYLSSSHSFPSERALLASLSFIYLFLLGFSVASNATAVFEGDGTRVLALTAVKGKLAVATESGHVLLYRYL